MVRNLPTDSRVYLVLLVIPAFALGQGKQTYLNVESPQVHPIDVVKVGNYFYIVACNTPDNSVEIYSVDESGEPIEIPLVARVRTGLEPVSVRWFDEFSDLTDQETIFVAGFLGDSITIIDLVLDQPSDRTSLRPIVRQTTHVTDEPLDIAYDSTHEIFYITHMTLDAYGAYELDAATGVLVPASSIQGAERIDATVEDGSEKFALKEPWTPQIVTCDNEPHLFILGHKGGSNIMNPDPNNPPECAGDFTSPNSPAHYDFDMYRLSRSSSGLSATDSSAMIQGLGTTNWGMAFYRGGVFVVGGDAQNSVGREENVRSLDTGFVKSMLYYVEDICDCPLTPHSSCTIHTRDLNEGVADESNALAQPTSVVVYEDLAETKVFVSAFSSDRIGVVVPSRIDDPSNWVIRTISILPHPDSPPNENMAGPRGMVLKPDNSANDIHDPGARLYVLNRIDNSISIVNPRKPSTKMSQSTTEAFLSTFALASDPTPKYITMGRKFLYDAKLSNGFNSCSSCHVDARTDGLVWDLSGGAPAPILPKILGAQFSVTLPDSFSGEKGCLVTQSLQGLLNFEVDNPLQANGNSLRASDLFTNAPYHWRGDRESFLNFRPAFVSLMDCPQDPCITDEEMKQFEAFINSVHYPPNPYQASNRRLSGELGCVIEDACGLATVSGTEARKGMNIFFTEDWSSPGFQSCVHCHTLPEGSNNLLTTPGPLESAALRGLYQKERRLDRGADSVPQQSPITGIEGMQSDGDRPSINGFINVAFLLSIEDLASLRSFVRELDFGVAPMVGSAYTVELSNASSSATEQAFEDGELQASEANAGFVVQAYVGGEERGYWYDLTGQSPQYRREVGEPCDPDPAFYSRQDIKDLVTASDDRLVLISVPLGSERRIACPSGESRAIGVDSIPALQSPSNIELFPMVTNTAYRQVPRLTRMADAPPESTCFSIPTTSSFNNSPAHTLRLYQKALLNTSESEGGGCSAGISQVRHEPPRRFRVAGNDIRHGAMLEMLLPHGTGTCGGQPFDPSVDRCELPNVLVGNQCYTPCETDLECEADEVCQNSMWCVCAPVTTALPTSNNDHLLKIVLPIHPTSRLTFDGRRIWETAAELEAMLYYRLMAGRPTIQSIPNVLETLVSVDFPVEGSPLGRIAENGGESNHFDPGLWNWHYVQVRNSDGSVNAHSIENWQRLRLAPNGDCTPCRADVVGRFGDCEPDGFADIHDYFYLNQCAAGVNPCDICCDVDCDGSVTTEDAQVSLCVFANGTEEICCEDCVSGGGQ